MKCYNSAARLALPFLAVLALAGLAAAGEQVPFKGRLEGTFTRTPTFPIAHVQLNGTGHATQLGQFTLDMPHDVDLSAMPTTGEGVFELTAANGDTVYGTFYGQATPTDIPGIIHGVEHMTILGGTGRFVDASGSFISERLIDRVNFTTIGSFEGTISSRGAGNR